MFFEDEHKQTVATITEPILAKKGSKSVIRANTSHKARIAGVYVFVSLKASTQRVVVTLAKKSDHQALLHHLYQVKRRAGKGRVYVTLDNDGAHHAKRLKRLAAKQGIHFRYLPSYSPDLNPAEEPLKQLKTYLRNRLFFTVEKLKQAIRTFFEQRNYTFDINVEGIYKNPAGVRSM
ncbi:MAG: IS630 family transposase [Candidatus Korarchaeota archaeon]|nr:IS630 family transposase [Candidatus Korarchaeota archaeon]